MIFKWNHITLSLLFSSYASLVDGHGYMYSPRSRNWVANEDGTDSWAGGGTAGTPKKEYCPHCLNSKAADEICGVGNAGNYDDWLDVNKDPIPWNSQATYVEGEIITVKSYMSTNHGGHMDLFICADGASSTQECLEANPLEYMDSTHNAPKDLKYPNRGYYSSDVDFEMRYKLPMGVTGDKVMMQWRYVTGNSCVSPGYCCHESDDYFDLYQNVSSWKRGNNRLCTYPLDPTGTTGTGKPELFWNCAEIAISPSNGQPTTPSPVAPITAPPNAPSPVWNSPTAYPISSPTTSSPVTGSGCCTIDFKSCSPTVVGWCSESRENCEGPCDKWWLPNGAVDGCNARYESCSTDSDCCSPGGCVGDVNGYKSCQETTGTSPPIPEPSSNPEPTAPTPSPTPPTNANYCCSFDYKTCGGSSYCSGGQSECEGSCQGLWIDDSLKQCAALYQQCSASGDCCGPAACSGSGGWMQCQPGVSTSNPTPVPSNAPIVVTPAPSKTPVIPVPTIAPTSPPNNGCYSNNYKDCIPDGYSSDASCTNVWLPNGAKNNCIALWGDCTGNESRCCEPSECFSDGAHASCVPVVDVTPTLSPSILQSSSPTTSCGAKDEQCQKNSDCCNNKCNKKKEKCKE